MKCTIETPVSDNMQVFLRVNVRLQIFFLHHIGFYFPAISCMLSRLSTAFNIPGFITLLCSPKWPNQTHSLLLFALVRLASEVEQQRSRGELVQRTMLMMPDGSLCGWCQSVSLLGAKKVEQVPDCSIGVVLRMTDGLTQISCILQL